MNKIFAFVALFISPLAFAQTTLLSEDFQNGFPSTWTRVDVDMQTPDPDVAEYNEAWIIKENPDSAGDSVISSTSYYSPAGTANKWLITPAINLGAFGNFLTWEGSSHDPSFPDGYYVLVSTTDSLVSSFTDTLEIVSAENEEWTFREVNLSDSGFNNQTIYIAFVNRTNDGFKLYLDNIEVRVDDPLTVHSNSLASFKVVPNPVSTELQIHTVKQIKEVLITDLNGRILIRNNNKLIAVNELRSGNYIVNIVFKDGSRSRQQFMKL